MTRVNSNLDSYILFFAYDAHIKKSFYFLVSFFTFGLLFQENLYTVSCVNFVKMAVMSGSETEFKNKKGAEMNYKINDKIAHFLFV